MCECHTFQSEKNAPQDNEKNKANIIKKIRVISTNSEIESFLQL